MGGRLGPPGADDRRHPDRVRGLGSLGRASRPAAAQGRKPMAEGESEAQAFMRRIGDGQAREEGVIPAATVVLVRDADGGGVETLMLRKTRGISFGGLWVFPGGRVEDADWDG
ncbi:hypothetical protein B7486_67260, partial [cyanobacterium TDX16]